MTDLEFIKQKPEFGPNEERAIIALAFELPEVFETVNQFIVPAYLNDTPSKLILSIINKYYGEYGSIPSRDVIRDALLKSLTVNDDYESYLKVVDTTISPRDMHIVKGQLLKWARDKAYQEVFSENTMNAYGRGDYDYIEKTLEKAKKITDFGDVAFNFFDRFDELFEPKTIEHFTTGFTSLDKHLNDGGPSRKEILCWMAPTGVGKSIAMINMGVANILRGRKVLHITCEMSAELTGTRYAGCFTNLDVNKRFDVAEKGKFKKLLENLKSRHNDHLYIQEYGNNEASVNQFMALLDHLRTHKQFVPDVIIVDYLDLVQSKVSIKNTNGDDYSKHKSVSEELRALAYRANALVVTATQTNRSGAGKDQNQDLDVDKVAESYGKTMALDYMVSLQQSKAEYNQAIPEMKLYISKNRNGQKFKTVNVAVKYVSSKMMETGDATG